MICPVCNNQNVEQYKMRDGVNKDARISCVGYHCHSCNHIGSALANTLKTEEVNRAFFLAETRFKTI